ncbi:MAG: hypothetical protein ACRCTY_05760 [Candidatus Adiutrix sp.]
MNENQKNQSQRLIFPKHISAISRRLEFKNKGQIATEAIIDKINAMRKN